MARYTTFGIGGCARYFVEAADERDVAETVQWAAEQGLALFVLGGGSNLLVADEGFDGVVLRVSIRGVEREGCRFDVGAGESWDHLVDLTLAADCAGMECLAGIPGSVGASPVQNVGAYGQEVAETIISVRALDRASGTFVEMTAEECQFRYRSSVFNTEERDRYVITRVRFELRAGGAPQLRYADLQRAFGGREHPPSLVEVAGRVRAIRGAKGMVIVPGDPDTQSAGSYFKNPVVPQSQVPAVARAAGVPDGAVPTFPAGQSRVKLSAAWLIERAGFPRGFRLGASGLSTRHTLALTNRGGAACAEILALEMRIREGVAARFGITLEREPVLLGTGNAARVAASS